MERALLLCADREITPDHLPLDKMRSGRWTLADEEPETSPHPNAERVLPSAPRSLEPTLPPPGVGHTPEQLRELLAGAERDRIVRALEACGGNQTRAAKMLGMARGTLIVRMQEFNLPRPRK
jgi:DNA-binding NtrC family response regulator